jgi:hypothetical protein
VKAAPQDEVLLEAPCIFVVDEAFMVRFVVPLGLSPI